jgi:hypothetical protein
MSGQIQDKASEELAVLPPDPVVQGNLYLLQNNGREVTLV